MLEPIRREHALGVMQLHHEELSGLLSALGPRAVRAAYEGYLASPRVLGFVEVAVGAVSGFVVGSDTPAPWRREAMRANPRAIALGVAAGLLTEPAAFPHALELLMPSAPFDPNEPELTYLAVAPSARRSGVATRLFDAFADGLRARGARAFALSVEEDNHRATAFYAARGMRRARVYRQFGKVYARYRLELAPS